MSTPTPPAAPLVTALARRYAVDIDLAYNGTAVTPNWERLIGVTSLTPSTPAVMQDDDDYDSDWTNQTKTMLGWALAMTIKIGTVGGEEPDVHIKLRDAATEFGDDGVIHVRWYDRNGGTAAYEGFAEVSWDEAGGGPRDLASASVNLTGKGNRNKITNPAPAA